MNDESWDNSFQRREFCVHSIFVSQILSTIHSVDNSDLSKYSLLIIPRKFHPHEKSTFSRLVNLLSQSSWLQSLIPFHAAALHSTFLLYSHSVSMRLSLFHPHSIHPNQHQNPRVVIPIHFEWELLQHVSTFFQLVFSPLRNENLTNTISCFHKSFSSTLATSLSIQQLLFFPTLKLNSNIQLLRFRSFHSLLPIDFQW